MFFQVLVRMLAHLEGDWRFARFAVRQLDLGDGTSRQLGKFTRLLVEGLRTGAGLADRDEITVADLFEHARRKLVAEDPRMRPQHWRERGEAPLVIARNPQARPMLPAELITARRQGRLASAPRRSRPPR